MTVIVGISDGDRVLIAGDSAGVAGWDLTVRADHKVFQRGAMAFGFTNSFRMGQLLRYKLEIPEHPEGVDTEQYLVTLFVEAVRSCLAAGGFASKENEQETGGTFLLGYRGMIWRIESDYQVGRSDTPFDAVGCGESVARGALYATMGEPDIMKRARVALEAAEYCNIGVRGPFHFAEASSSTNRPSYAASTLPHDPTEENRR